MTASPHARRRALTATLLLATTVGLCALGGPGAPTAMAQQGEEADGQRSAAGGAGSGIATAPEHRSRSRDETDEASGRRESLRARTDARRHHLDELRAEVRREARARAQPMRRHRAEARREARSRAEAMRRNRAEVRREARSRAQAMRRNARDGTRSGAGARPARSRSRGRARPDSDEAMVSIAGHERIELLPGRRHILRRTRALVRGYVPSGRSGRTVVLEVLLGRDWLERDRALTGAEGKFYLAWYPSRTGRFRVRVREVTARANTLPSNTRLLYVYRRAVASWYGPGFYGNRTACGQTFTSRLLGVAHRSLPCGYRVTVRYRGRAITVPVVDRGPYVDGRDYDLTNATREYLDFEGVGEIWATA